MIRTTYKGRELKILAARGKPLHVKLVVNGQIIHHAWQGADVQGLDWFRQVIDRIDAAGGPGLCANLILGYTHPQWWEPGTFDVNQAGHATQPGGICLCSRCTVSNEKARYAPLPPDACRHCHEGPDDHNPRPLSVSGSHPYTEPTHEQRRGREATQRLNAMDAAQ